MSSQGGKVVTVMRDRLGVSVALAVAFSAATYAFLPVGASASCVGPMLTVSP